MGAIALLALTASLSVMAAAILMVVRAPALRFRWLWSLAALLAAGQWGYSFATGASKVVLLHGALVGAWVSRQDPPGGWTIKSAVPLGALIVIALLRLRRKPASKAARDIPPP